MHCFTTLLTVCVVAVDAELQKVLTADEFLALDPTKITVTDDGLPQVSINHSLSKGVIISVSLA